MEKVYSVNINSTVKHLIKTKRKTRLIFASGIHCNKQISAWGGYVCLLKILRSFNFQTGVTAFETMFVFLFNQMCLKRLVILFCFTCSFFFKSCFTFGNSNQETKFKKF